MFEIELFICIKMDLAINNLQWLMCGKTKQNQTKPSLPYYAHDWLNVSGGDKIREKIILNENRCIKRKMIKENKRTAKSKRC